MPTGLGNSAPLILIIIFLSTSIVLRDVLCLASILSILSSNPTRFYNTLPLLLGLLDTRFDLGTILGLSLSISGLVFAPVNTLSKVFKVVVQSVGTVFNLASRAGSKDRVDS
jgi:hypothetical protein